MTDADYRKLYHFRARLRRFLRSSDERVRKAGLTPSHYLLLLGIRSAPSSRGPTIGDMAEFLVLKHHTVVELVDRAETAGLLRRSHDPDDGRVVRLSLTSSGRQRLERVAAVNYLELAQLELISDALDTPGDR
jgi:DNA-binding MarR family transcriptional regulator